ncbi:hypothetical protein [Pygmaiobacter massiliensis]|uniref:hypothetical protein n=1 Tax=Pygmaiobacter massiliensis TaxID=1917873 RepID=UPI002A829E96|nr:hypothetical protein [Pygmaiobacter massiliensis]MDY4783918.1 hypothetical protein [Pygmaiobacter massiliensis]
MGNCFYSYKMPDGKLIMVGLPAKKQLSQMILVAQLSEEETITQETVDAMYDAASAVLSRNKTKTKVSAEDLDVKQMQEFFKGYGAFIEKELSRPN